MLEIEEENVLISLASTDKEKDNQKENKTSINLGDCEDKLKEAYKIPKNNSLYILKIQLEENGMKIPKIEYEVYYPLFDKNLIKLNLTECKDTKIEISIPVSIVEDLDKYNSNSDYYNDICTKTTSDSGTDISLTDRKQEFINNNMSLCEEDCNLISYNYTNEKAKCSCLVKINLPFIEDIKFDKNKLYKSFKSINNIINIKILKCYKTIFSKNSLKNNYGFFIYIFIFILYFIVLILFCFKYYFILQRQVKNIEKNIYSTFKQKSLGVKKTNFVDNINMQGNKEENNIK